MRAIASGAVLSVCLLTGLAQAQAPSDDLGQLTLEELSNLVVTTVSRRPEELAKVAAAVEIITGTDIRRSGAQSLPEMLRLARNLEVARVSSQHYAISARGFNTFQASNKLLVLIDGRSVYTPLYSGVFWDQQFVSPQDIDRIEVISGPGGTLWGANAVNGVVNVITKSTEDTRGLFAQAVAGSVDQRLDLRYGGRTKDGALSYRVYATGIDRGSMLTSTGGSANDDWSAANVGFRADWGDAQDTFMAQGAYHERMDAHSDNPGGNILSRWTHVLHDGSQFELQAFYSSEFAAEGGVSDELQTWDIGLQHTTQLGVHRLIWGGGFRKSESEFINSNSPARLVPQQRGLQTTNLFVQDEIALSQALALTAGLKVENHTFTDLEYMPNLRLAWRLDSRGLIWGAISRAVRTPSRIDRELTIPGTFVAGGFESEYLTAYELGYRTQPTRNSSLSANLYYHDYDGIRTLNLTPPGVLPARYGNGLHGNIYGLELWGDVDVNDAWRLSAGITLLKSKFRTDPLAVDFNGLGDDPSYQVFLRSHIQLAQNWALDFNVRGIDEITPQIPAYVDLNARLAWRIGNIEISLAGQNLFDKSHPESFDEGALLETRRNVQLSASVSY